MIHLTLPFLVLSFTSAAILSHSPDFTSLCTSRSALSSIALADTDVVLSTASCLPSPATTRLSEICPKQNVCAQPCFTSCSNDAGVLPPVEEDCQVVEDAVHIYLSSNSTPPTFVLPPQHLITLTYATCDYFFFNNNPEGGVDVEYCWENLVKSSKGAGKACFPPVQPFSSQGTCRGGDGFWYAGASHS